MNPPLLPEDPDDPEYVAIFKQLGVWYLILTIIVVTLVVVVLFR